jgi:hypothetical protein
MGYTQIRTKNIYIVGRQKFQNCVHRTSHGNIVVTVVDSTLYITFEIFIFWTLCRFLIYLEAAVHQTGAAYFTIDVSEILLCTVAAILVTTSKIKFILLCHWPVFYESPLRQTAYLIWGISCPPIWYEEFLVLLFDMRNCLSSYLIRETVCPRIWYEELLVLLFDMRNCLSSYLIWGIACPLLWYEELLVLLFDMRNCLSSYLIWGIAFPPIWYEELFVLLFDSTIHDLVFCYKLWQNNFRFCGLL